MPAPLREQQLHHLIDLTTQHYPRHRWYLFDAYAILPVPFAIFNRQRAAVYVSGKYLVYNRPRHIAFFEKEFDNLIRHTIIHPHETADWLKDQLTHFR